MWFFGYIVISDEFVEIIKKVLFKMDWMLWWFREIEVLGFGDKVIVFCEFWDL